MAVYRQDDPAHFAAALDSLQPFVADLEAVVVVADGLLTPELYSAIEIRAQSLKITQLQLPQSVGLGQALNAGLRETRSDFVLRMDADDLCRPERLNVLMQRLADDPRLDVVGSFIAEFDKDPALPHAERRVPLMHAEIERCMRTRCVMNHVSCLLRRQTVIEVGGYSGGSGFAEDWWLWARLLSFGARFGNVDRVLVDVRVGNGFIGRRRGWAMLQQDLKLLGMMRRIGFISWLQAAYLLLVKILQRMLPAVITRRVYTYLRHPLSIT